MLRIDEICVKKEQGSKIICSKVEQTLENKLKEFVAIDDFTVRQDDMQIKVMLKKYISFQAVNKILNVFSKEKIKIEKVTWKRKVKGIFTRGHLEIIIS